MADVAGEQRQAVHALTHPGASKHARGAQPPAQAPMPQPGPPDAAQALLRALQAEAEDEGGDAPDSAGF